MRSYCRFHSEEPVAPRPAYIEISDELPPVPINRPGSSAFDESNQIGYSTRNRLRVSLEQAKRIYVDLGTAIAQADAEPRP